MSEPVNDIKVGNYTLVVENGQLIAKLERSTCAYPVCNWQQGYELSKANILLGLGEVKLKSMGNAKFIQGLVAELEKL